MKLYIICCLLFSSLPVTVFSQETLTITTYYPSPSGVYKELKLQPQTTPPSPCNSSNSEGKMYYDRGNHTVYICTDTGGGSYSWEALNISSYSLMGWCRRSGSSCNALAPAFCIVGNQCQCPSGYTRIVTGEDSSGYTYYSCYKN